MTEPLDGRTAVVPAVAPSASGGVAAEGAQSAAHPGTEGASSTEGVSSSGPIIDVWSRTAPKYRVRAIALLVLNLLLYSGLCIFIYWLREARLFEFTLSSYVDPARFWTHDAPSLNDYLLDALRVERLPEYTLVLGLVLGALVAVPIVIAILYRFPSAIPFCAAVLIFAHMPWLGFTLLLSCVLASTPPFRFQFRFGSALVGMLPVVLYFYLASRGAPDAAASFIAPTERSLLSAPWVLAILAGATMLGAILMIARVVNYRPGAVAPVVAVVFAVPVLLFHWRIGVDELAYRALEARYGPHAKRFAPVLSARETEESVLELIANAMRGSPAGRLRRGLQGVWSEDPVRIRELKHDVRRSFLADLLEDRTAAQEACERFLREYPSSRYVPNVLYLQGRLLDLRFDERRFDQELQRELYDDFAHLQALPIWSRLLREFPQSPLAVLAGLRRAQGLLRQGETDAALRALEQVLAMGDPWALRSAQSRPVGASLLQRPAPESSLDFEASPYSIEAARLRELIAENANDPLYGAAPLRELACLDPRRGLYLPQLFALVQRYPDALLRDNLLVRIAGALKHVQHRAAALAALLDALPEGDARAEALFQLADLEIQALSTDNPALRAVGLARLREVAERYSDRCWGKEAALRLRMIEPPAAAHTERE